jgi:hypothetical protein
MRVRLALPAGDHARSAFVFDQLRLRADRSVAGQGIDGHRPTAVLGREEHFASAVRRQVRRVAVAGRLGIDFRKACPAAFAADVVGHQRGFAVNGSRRVEHLAAGMERQESGTVDLGRQLGLG